MNTVFRWQRDPDPEALARLHRLAPPQDHMAHLALFWSPGRPEVPVQRWMIYECTPTRYVERKVADLLRDPPCTCAVRPSTERCDRCKRYARPLRAQIYTYWRRTGCLAEPLWVIQGDQGGHRFHFTDTEADWDRLLGGSGEAPQPGSLPYADLDGRVVARLQALDRTRRAWTQVATAEAHDRQRAEEEFRRALLAYATAGMDELSKDVAYGLGDADVPMLDPAASPWLADYDRWAERFITTGRAA